MELVIGNEEYKKYLRCKICGSENRLGANFCSECGAKLDEENSEIVEERIITANSDDKKVESSQSKKDLNKKMNNKNILKDTKAEKPRVINLTKVLYIVLFLVIVGAVLIYTSGILDEPSVSEGNQQNQTQDFHNGVDLSVLQEINALRTTVQSNPKDYDSMLQLAHRLNDSGFYPEAIKWYKQYLEANPNTPDVWIDMGVCYYQQNQFDEAISAMKKGVEINPQHQIGNFNLGVVYLAKNDINVANSYFKKAIAIDPNSNIAQKAKDLIQNNQ